MFIENQTYAEIYCYSVLIVFFLGTDYTVIVSFSFSKKIEEKRLVNVMN